MLLSDQDQEWKPAQKATGRKHSSRKKGIRCHFFFFKPEFTIQDLTLDLVKTPSTS